jgi:hypothetical protein
MIKREAHGLLLILILLEIRDFKRRQNTEVKGPKGET